MARVIYVLGDCPSCGSKNAFGNVDVCKTYVYQGCKRCQYSERLNLPQLRKKILYLDQFFFSRAFNGGERLFIELIRNLKQQVVTGLIDQFDGWRKSHSSFEADLQLEYEAVGKKYIDFYRDYIICIAKCDYDAIINPPIISMIIPTMLDILPSDMPMDQKLCQCTEFLCSDHFKQLPYQRLSARMSASLKAMVKGGAYTNYENALRQLSGFVYDVKHIATYAPYVDGFVMDKAMAALVSKPTVALEETYGTKVFSLNNWDELFVWLDSLETNMSHEHKAGLAAAYPR